MPKVDVTFKISPGAGVSGYWVAVGDDDVTLVNGKGLIGVVAGASQMLTWWFIGNPGSTLKVEGTAGRKTVVEVKESKIPPNKTQGAGSKHFTV